MNPKDKAKELVHIFYAVIPRLGSFTNNWECAKQCALICVDELIKAFKQLSIEDSGSVFRDFGHTYWEQVKQEIEKL
jgi:hypothetical protein